MSHHYRSPAGRARRFWAWLGGLLAVLAALAAVLLGDRDDDDDDDDDDDRDDDSRGRPTAALVVTA